ncbi:MAG: HAD family phosphatase [Tissierellia bacterium]|nr:HAD family phosphatase [Tissierellia bacterium]
MIIAFDFDGTLIDSMPLWRNLGRSYLEGRGLAFVPEIREQIKSITLEAAAALFKDYYGLKESTEEIYWDMAKIIERGYREELPLKPYARQVLESLQEKHSLLLATATRDDLLKPALDRFDLWGYFQGIYTAASVGKLKNDPDYYRALVERLGIAPGELILVDDAEYALEAAKEAGVFTIGIYDELHGKNWDRIVAASQHTVQNLKELMELKLFL